MVHTLARNALTLIAAGFAPFTAHHPTHHAGYAGSWRGRANLPASMHITGVDVRLVVHANGRASCVAVATWAGDGSRSRVRGRGWIYASGRCARWLDDPSRPRVIVHTIARLAAAASQVTFDLFLPDGSELFGYATLRNTSEVMKTSF